MTDVLNVLTRKTSLRKACKELAVSELEKLSENLLELVEERKQEEAAVAAQLAEKQASIDAIKKQMAESGLDLSDLLGALEAGAAAKPKGTVKPKYQITDDEGNVHQWTGRGRTPKVFQQFFDNGGSKEDCLID
ncbi:H-NS family nucleoid-associated regulatory protein [Motiliproteus sp.]|uniref:H-NS histone family protein n=1 Tax=Motiliproteus sp. TaxID=1898955 RepID=UPI003BADAC58